ncbi:MAG: VTT domain-containing protein [Bacilli bacterium]|nr:VTT domain-containing protein [Bacilli bacterium]
MKLPSKEKLKKYLKILIVLLVVATISVVLYFVLKHFGLTDVQKLKGFLKSVGPWAVIIYILLRVFATIFLSFVPACSMAFDLLSIATFDYYPPIVIFLICFASVVITSVIMDLIGRFGGNKAIIKILGREDYEEAIELVQEKGLVYVPVMYLLPIFPDDAICMVSGATKMNFWVHLLEIILCRGIGCATIVFGLQIIPQDLVDNLKAFNWVFIGNNIIEYIRLLVLIVAYLGLLFWFTRKIDKWLTKFLKKRKEKAQLAK